MWKPRGRERLAACACALVLTLGWLGRPASAADAPADSLGAEVIVDNTDTAADQQFIETTAGAWERSDLRAGCYGSNYRLVNTTASAANATATWKATAMEAGWCEVFAWWPADAAHTTTARYVIHTAGGNVTVTADQTLNGGQWVSLGTYAFLAGQHQVDVTNEATAPNRYVIADAVKFTPTFEPATTTSTTVATTSTTSTTTSTTTTTTLPGGEWIIDDGTNPPDRSFLVVTGAWGLGSTLSDRYGTASRYASISNGAVTARARWSITSLPAGSYEVYAWWPATSNRSKRAAYVIKDGATELATVRVDQTQNGGKWNLLGVYAFSVEGTQAVEVHNGLSKLLSSEVYVGADAVRFVSGSGVVTTTTAAASTSTSATTSTTIDPCLLTTTTGASTTSTTGQTTTTTTLPGGEWIIDDGTNPPDRSFLVVTGTWGSGSTLSDRYGTASRYASTSNGAVTARARWSITSLPAGSYEVYAWWPATSNRSKRAAYVIKDGATELATVRVDQTQNGGKWNLLGVYAFSVEGAQAVEVHNGLSKLLSSEVYVGADAVRFVSAGFVTTTTTVSSTTTTESGSPTTTLMESMYIVDDLDNTATKRFQILRGVWDTGSTLPDRYGATHRVVRAPADYSESARARWTYADLPAGTYDVYAWWTAYDNRSYATPYVIKDGDTELATVRVNQSVNGGKWNYLGTYTFRAGGHNVEIHNGNAYRPSPL